MYLLEGKCDGDYTERAMCLTVNTGRKNAWNSVMGEIGRTKRVLEVCPC